MAWQSEQRGVSKLQRKSHACKVGFISAELDLGLTFASIAVNAGPNAEKKARNERLARQAYNAAGRFFADADLSDAEREALAKKTQQLEAKLASLTSHELKHRT